MFVITQVKYVTINTAEFGELPLMNPISNMADNYYLLRPSPYLLALSTMPENRRNLDFSFTSFPRSFLSDVEVNFFFTFLGTLFKGIGNLGAWKTSPDCRLSLEKGQLAQRGEAWKNFITCIGKWFEGDARRLQVQLLYSLAFP